jgi:pimeloyl-ACP methyl ester carboxylesterase
MDKTILHGPLTLFYRDEGPGETPGTIPTPGTAPAAGRAPGLPLTVMLIHGFAEDGAIWDRQTEYLKKNHRLLIPDLPGSGKSSPISAETTMDELADPIKAILDAEKIGRVVLIGHSMGGYVALAFAEKYPGRLEALGLFHSTAYADTEEKKAARQKGIGFIRNNGSAPFVKQSIPNLFAERSGPAHAAIIAELTSRYSNSDPASLIYYYHAMIGRPDRTEVLKKINIPVLFIIGEQDSSIPMLSSLQQTHLPALAHIHILGDAGHMGMLEEEQASNAILENFLSFLRPGIEPVRR